MSRHLDPHRSSTAARLRELAERAAASGEVELAEKLKRAAALREPLRHTPWSGHVVLVPGVDLPSEATSHGVLAVEVVG